MDALVVRLKKHIEDAPRKPNKPTLLSKAKLTIKDMYHQLRDPAALPFRFRHFADLYVHTGVPIRPGRNAIPCKRPHDVAKQSWEHWPSASQQTRRLQPPPCPFFDLLPRELRDLIYGFCTDESRPNTKAVQRQYVGTTKAVARNAPWRALTLCSKRLAQEYKESIWAMTTLVLIDYFNANMGLSAPPLHPHLWQNLTRMDTVLLAVCEICERSIPHGSHRCGLLDELKNHHAWLVELTDKMPKLKTLNVKFYIQWPREHQFQILQYPRNPHPVGIEEHVKALLDLRATKSVEVHRHRSMDAINGFDARKAEAEVFDLYVRASWVNDGFEFYTVGSEVHQRLEREWWVERQQKGVVAWEGSGNNERIVVGG